MTVELQTEKVFPKMRYFSMAWLKALWRGDRPLWEAWWVFGAGTTIISYGVAFLGAYLLRSPIVEIFLGIWEILIIGVQIFLWVSAWKCAPNTHNKF
ncbi:MAG: hypothetical protein GYA36_16455 [Veillonellaceae bacterium]|nr:hypothetical protein [Veillonellaceae bacterium]